MEMQEPLVMGTIIVPDEYIGDMISLFMVRFINLFLVIVWVVLRYNPYSRLTLIFWLEYVISVLDVICFYTFKCFSYTFCPLPTFGTNKQTFSVY